ncbi:MAG: hypothetical protein ACYDHD_11485 [Vulcanimicrobiaceae bacterium]
MQRNSSPTNIGEQTFFDYISSTRLGFVFIACFVVFTVWSSFLARSALEERSIALNVSFIYASGDLLFTWLRWRYKSLGMVLISLYAYNWLLTLFALVSIPYAE